MINTKGYQIVGKQETDDNNYFLYETETEDREPFVFSIKSKIYIKIPKNGKEAEAIGITSTLLGIRFLEDEEVAQIKDDLYFRRLQIIYGIEEDEGLEDRMNAFIFNHQLRNRFGEDEVRLQSRGLNIKDLDNEAIKVAVEDLNKKVMDHTIFDWRRSFENTGSRRTR